MNSQPTTSLALAVDIGGTKVDAALVTSEGHVVEGSLCRALTGPHSSRAQLISSIDDAVRGTLSVVEGTDQVCGAGIGSAGPIDLETGSISPKNLPKLHSFRVQEHVRGLLPGRPAVLRLDGTCIALAEQWLGATRGYSNSMSMVVSTGIGGGLILQDTLLAGRTGNAGHIGQLRIRARAAGQRRDTGTLEAMASGPQTVAWARSQGWAGETGEDLAESYAGGDAVAQEAVRRSANAVGEAISSVTTLLDLEIVAIGGGFVNVSGDYLDLVREAVKASTVLSYTEDVTVVKSGLGGFGPLLGAAALIHRHQLLGLRTLNDGHQSAPQPSADHNIRAAGVLGSATGRAQTAARGNRYLGRK